MGIFKSLFKPVKSIFKGIKNKILKPTERFLRKHKKTLLTAALITGLVFTGGALAGAGWAGNFATATGIGAGNYAVIPGAVADAAGLGSTILASGTPSATSLAGSTAAYGGATSLATQETASLLAGTPDAPFQPGSPRFSRGGIGQRYDRPSMSETLNFGIGGSTVNPYVS